MAAAVTDKFIKVSRKWVGQIGSAGVSDAIVTTIPLSSATNLPTDTLVEIVIDRVDSSGTKTASLEETVTGIVSGNNIISAVRGVEGTAQAHSAGAVVEVLFTAHLYNNLIDGLLVSHLQTGAHSPSSISASMIAASGIVAGNLGASSVLAGNLAASSVTLGNIDNVLDEDTMVSNSATSLATQQSIKAYTDNRTTTFGIQVVDSGSDTATGDGAAFFRVPSQLNGFNLTAVSASVYTAGTTGTTDIQLRNKTQTADILSTKITIDSGETDSSTAATPAVINTSEDDVATGDIIAVDVDAVSTTEAQGLFIELTFTKP